MTTEYNALLSRLVGYHLQSIHLAGGYLQFTFTSLSLGDHPVLTFEAMPVVETPAGPIVNGQTGYADAIRALIGHHVTATGEAAGEGIRIEFAETALKLQPAAEELHGPVLAMLSDFGDCGSRSWGPGGPAFEYLAEYGPDRHPIAGDR
ncbi:hypothetical protein PDG61_17595 [Mycolicibacterium sp. BiH015]|uniref:hypothetical protein n=1 Tax=Mycolicibacterium sp. BiH015 TaxID=3018808 RepID=UPI0022E102C0|nr:hypothetical protein [Mycolicibacterium sp. BiH015]MDA2892738.1 hypothetical protein [Mycolicibacterium sp. BiH015]